MTDILGFYRAGTGFLVLLVREALHVLLEHLLILRRIVVAEALAGKHRLPEPGRQVAPAARPLALGAELVDGLAVAVRIVGLVRGILGLIGLPGLGLRLLGLLGLPRLALTLSLGRLDPADDLAQLVRAVTLGLLRLLHQLLDLFQ